MSETTSQNILWLDEKSDDQRMGSTKPLFPNGNGRVLFRESVKQDNPSSKLTVLSYSGQAGSAPLTMGWKPLDVKIPRVKKFGDESKERYILLQKYQGFISSRGKDSFTARLFDGASDCSALEAEFDLQELSNADQVLAVVGAALVWTIGYYENGPRKRESLIYIRRRPGWTDREAKEAKADAEALTSDIDWK